MDLPPFALERWFARFEFAVPWILCASAVEEMGLAELLALADEECRGLWADLALGYTESAGHPLLRAEIAGLHEGVDPTDVLVCAGAEEAIFLLASATVGPGDHAVCVSPAYQSLHEVARGGGAEVTMLPLDPERGWALDLDRLGAALRPGTRLVAINSPHNPTGWLPDRADFDAIVAMTDAAGATLLSDEVYRELEHDPVDRLPAAVEVSERAASVGVMSKAYGLAGLRIGWIATRDRGLLARCAALKDFTSICSSAPSEILALIALRARESVLARSRAIVAGKLPILADFIASHPRDLAWVPPRGGPVAFPRLLRHCDAEHFARDLAEREGVLLLPGAVFGGHPDHVRIGFGRRDMVEGLDRLGRALARG